MPAPACPHCGFQRSWSIRRSKRKCKQCRKEWSATMYPVVHIRSTNAEWKACIHVFLRERTIARVVAETHLPHSRVERMLFHLRSCMAQDMPLHLPGIVEMDETYIGGQRKNKRLHIRRIQGKRGHGTDKLPIVGLFSRTSGEVYVEVLSRKLDMARITAIIAEHTTAGAEIYTDGFNMYRGLTKKGYRHAYVDHDGGELVRGEVHSNNIEGFWGILKRKLSCIGGMRRVNLHFFVGEIAWKFNHRELSLPEQEERLLQLIIQRFGG